MKRRLFAAAALASIALPGFASAASPVVVADAWARPPAGGTSAVYATISNEGDVPDRLIGAMTPAAAGAELRDPAKGTVAALTVPAHGSLILAPGGPSVVFTGVKPDGGADDAFLARLHFERAGWIVTIVRVRSSTIDIPKP